MDSVELLNKIIEVDNDTTFWNAVGNTFDLMEHAEGQIRHYMNRYPNRVAELWDAFDTVRPPDNMSQMHPKLYQSHVDELLQRVAQNASLDGPTKAEMLMAMMETLLVTPITQDGALVYRRLFCDVMGTDELERLGITTTLLESYEGVIDEHLAYLQRKFRSKRHRPDPTRWDGLTEKRKAEILA